MAATHGNSLERRISRGSLVSFDVETSRGRSTSLSVYENTDEIAKNELGLEGESAPLLVGGKAEESMLHEIMRTWALAWPVVCTFFLQVGPGMVSLVFVGHLPKKEYLAASTLGVMSGYV